jgi:hypothetical protein
MGTSIVGVLFWGEGREKVYFARRLTEPVVAEERRRDKRRPVLFLRSFLEDRVGVARAEKLIASGMTSPFFEAGLTTTTRRYGPFIAIAEPGQMSPGGAARAEFTTERWQTAVQAWADEALFIVLLAGVTAGLQWEIEHLIQRAHTGKLIILLPWPTRQAVSSEELRELGHYDTAVMELVRKRIREEKKEIWGRLCQFFEGTLWHPTFVNADERDALAVLCRPGGEIFLLRSKFIDTDDYGTAVDLAVYAMFCFRR